MRQDLTPGPGASVTCGNATPPHSTQSAKPQKQPSSQRSRPAGPPGGHLSTEGPIGPQRASQSVMPGQNGPTRTAAREAKRPPARSPQYAAAKPSSGVTPGTPRAADATRRNPGSPRVGPGPRATPSSRSARQGPPASVVSPRITDEHRQRTADPASPATGTERNARVQGCI